MWAYARGAFDPEPGVVFDDLRLAVIDERLADADALTRRKLEIHAGDDGAVAPQLRPLQPHLLHAEEWRTGCEL